MGIGHFEHDDGSDQTPIQPALDQSGDWIVRDLEYQTKWVYQVETDLLVSIADQLVRTHLGQLSKIGQRRRGLQLLETHLQSACHLQAELTDHLIVRGTQLRELVAAEGELHVAYSSTVLPVR